MKKFLFLILLTFNAYARLIAPSDIPQVIYGIDNREDVFESSDDLLKEIARSTAAQIYDDKLEGLILKAPSFKEQFNLCDDEKFAEQPAAANCSGFLVGTDVLVTAGHCVRAVADCDYHQWVFDYANTEEEKSTFQFRADQVYRCTKILERAYDSETMNDYAVVKLDRPVSGRRPLKVRRGGKMSSFDTVAVLGYPSGLPLKITSGAEIRKNSNAIFFETNADTFGRNSGSAVVNVRTGLVEGILVRGDTDFINASGRDCMISNHNEMDKGRGEEVTRITNIKLLRK